jgi:hypothetical protein
MRYSTATLVVIMALVMVLSPLGSLDVKGVLSPANSQAGPNEPVPATRSAGAGPHYMASGLTVKGNFMPWVCQFCTWSGSNSSFATEYNPYASNMTQLSTEMYYLSSSCTNWFCSRGYEDTSNDLTAWDHAHGVRPLPMITTCTISVLQSFLGTSSNWAGFISTAVSTAQKYGYGGYNIDWEPDTSCASGTTTAQNGYELAHFIDQFANASHVDNMIITLDFAYWDTLFWNTAALAKSTGDTFMEMNYQCPGSGFTSNLAADVKNIGVAKLGEGLDPESGCTNAQMVTEFGQVAAAHVTNIEWWCLDDTTAALSPALWTAVHDFVYQNAYNGTTNQTYSSGAWGLNTNEHPTASGGNLYLFTLGNNEQGYMDATITGATAITTVNITQQVSLNSANYRIYEGNLTATDTIQSSWQLPDVNTTLHLGPPAGSVVSVFFELATYAGGTVGGYLAGAPGTYAYFSVQINGGAASSLSSVAVAPTTPTVPASGTQPFTATPTCTSTCPGGITYTWALSSTALGTVSGSGATDTFSAGTTAGTVGLFVNATLSGVTKGASTVITVTATPVTLTSVSLSPTTPSVNAGGTQPFMASPVCSSTCPGAISYVWALTSTALGSITGTGSSVTFNAGSISLTGGIFVNATLSGTTRGDSTVITIANGVTLTSVSMTPGAPTVPSGGKQLFKAVTTCSSTCPTSGIAYSWSLTSTKLGTLNGTGASVTFNAGTVAGTLGIYLNATLSGTTMGASTLITVTVANALTSVALSPTVPSVLAGKTQGFTATPTCTSTCPTSDISYAWALSSSSLGSLSGSGTTDVFTASNTAGTVGIFVNATLNGTVQKATTEITVTAVTLTSVSMSPILPSVAASSATPFTATPTCSATCPGTIAYVWSLTNAALGAISGSGASVTFYAGANSLTGGIFVNASLGGTVQGASTVISVTGGSPTPVLEQVSLSPSSVNVSAGASQTFTTETTCTGGQCPSTITYAWTLNNTLGNIAPTGSGVTAQFTAGSTTGVATVMVSATLNGKTVHASSVVNLVASRNGGGGSLFSNWFLLLLIGAAVVVVVAIVAVVVGRRKKPTEAPPLPEWPQPQMAQPAEISYSTDGTGIQPPG